jgi:hypothetical protein
MAEGLRPSSVQSSDDATRVRRQLVGQSRHCEERSNEAIQKSLGALRSPGLLRSARNDACVAVLASQTRGAWRAFGQTVERLNPLNPDSDPFRARQADHCDVEAGRVPPKDDWTR